MKLNISTIISRLGLLSLSAAMLVGCSDDIEVPYDGSDNGTITLVAKCGDMLPQFIDPTDVGSRAGGPKDEDEKRINTLHVFFFDGEADPSTKKNRLLTLTELGFDAYQRITTNVMSVPSLKDAFDGDFSGKEILVCALANLSNGTKFKTAYSLDGDMKGVKISDTPDETEPYVYDEITCLQDLQNWVYCPILRSEEGTAVSDLPKAGMPMIGEKRISSADYQSNKNILIPMKAMMARVDVNVKLDPENESSTGLPRMTITEYGVRNMPKRVPYVARTCGTKQNPDTTVQPIEPEFTQSVNITIDKNSDVVRFHYYTYENVRQPNWEAKRTDGSNAYNDNYTEINYPINNPTTMQKQRWKPTIAQKGTASAVVLKANYTTHQNLNYKAQFTIYMGENTTDNFEVHRNRQYVNNISIRGLDYVRNSDDGVYTFDGRVNVVSDNPVYLAIVNERKVDAHASVRPMDVWFLLREPSKSGEPLKKVDWYSEVEVSIVDPDKCGWVRMELVRRSVMEEAGFKAGTGARDYFTTDLVTNTLAGNDRVLIRADKDNNDPNYEQSRSRVYFYIDENVTPNAQGEILDRIAKVNIVYRKRESENGPILDERIRTLEIEQRGLKKITYTHPSSATALKDTYMEYYEEYLEHYDPLDQHTMPGELYEGMPWGVEGTRYDRVQTGTFLGFPVYDTYSGFDDVYDEGLQATQWVIVKRSGTEGYVSMSTVKLYNDAPPVTAFHYCYGKNKRKADGTVDGASAYNDESRGGWYLPGIRELERALTEYYLTFSDFKGNFYWSSSAAQSVITATDRARATKAIVDGSSVRYAESGGSTDANNYLGTGNDKGRAKRSENLRVRAFYKLPK